MCNTGKQMESRKQQATTIATTRQDTAATFACHSYAIWPRSAPVAAAAAAVAAADVAAPPRPMPIAVAVQRSKDLCLLTFNQNADPKKETIATGTVANAKIKRSI